MNTISLDDIEQARKRIAQSTLRSPLVHLHVDDAPADIYLKLENLQPTGSFKARGAGNAIALLSDKERNQGVYTCSAGNMAQALAYHARQNRIPCTVIVPDTAPEWLAFQERGFRVHGTREYLCFRSFQRPAIMSWLFKHWHYTRGDTLARFSAVLHFDGHVDERKNSLTGCHGRLKRIVTLA